MDTPKLLFLSRRWNPYVTSESRGSEIVVPFDRSLVIPFLNISGRLRYSAGTMSSFIRRQCIHKVITHPLDNNLLPDRRLIQNPPYKMLFCFPEAIDMFLMYNDLLACLRIDFINLVISVEKYNRWIITNVSYFMPDFAHRSIHRSSNYRNYHGPWSKIQSKADFGSNDAFEEKALVSIRNKGWQ